MNDAATLWPPPPPAPGSGRALDAAFYHLAAGQVRARLVATALELGLLTWLAGRGPAGADEVAAALALEPRRAAKWLHLLAVAGLVVERDGPAGPGYALAEGARGWLAGGAGGVYAGIVAMTRWATERDWAEVLRGAPVEGAMPWPPRDEAAARLTEELMAKSARGPLEVLEALFAAGAPRRVLDVGGGDGTIGLALTARCPQIERWCLLNLPAGAALARARVGESARLEVHAADFLVDAFPRGFDAVLFSRVLNDWGPAASLRLLRAARAALDPGGELIVCEVFADDEARDFVLAWEGRYLLYDDAQPRAFKPPELYRRLAEAAGFDAVTWGLHPSGLYGWLRARARPEGAVPVPAPARAAALPLAPAPEPEPPLRLAPVAAAVTWPRPLPAASGRAMDLAFYRQVAGSVRARLLESALDLGLLGLLEERRRHGEGPSASWEVARALGTEPLRTDKWLHLLALAGVVELAGSGAPRYQASVAARQWFGPEGQGGFYHEVVRLTRWATERDWVGALRGAAAPGAIVWPPRADEDARATEGLMERSALGPLLVLRDVIDPARHRRVLDVGGGNGAIGLDLTAVRPGIERWCLLNLPAGAELARARIAAGGGRLEVHPADFTRDPFPRGFDTVLFSRVLNDWGPATSRLLLEKARAALDPGGELIVCEIFADDCDDFVLAWEGRYLLYDTLETYVFKPPELYAALAREVGFGDVRYGRHPTGLYGVLTARAPD